MPFRPMLAAKAPEDLSKVRFPTLVSPKLDGVRCIIQGGQAYSRSMKLLPNKYVQRTIGLNRLPDGLDGELIVGSPTAPDVWNKTSSGIMSADGEPNFKFYVFDLYDPEKPFRERFREVQTLASKPLLMCVPHTPVDTLEKLDAIEDRAVLAGYEGIMLRDPEGTYKQGRSTLKEGGLLKVKRFDDMEATIIGLQEEMHNGNEAKTNEVGRTERSSHKEGLTGKGVLGAFVCHDAEGREFKVGTGFTADERERFFDNKMLGKVITVRHKGVTVNGLPLFPAFKGFRKD